MVFIGGINLNNDAQGGQEAKNQQIVSYLNANKIQATIIDTYNWRKRFPILLFSILKHTLFLKNTTIYVAISYKSLNSLLKLFNALGITKRNSVFYIVIGGKLHQWLEEHPSQVKNFKPLTCIYPESKSMVTSLKKSGLPNVKQVPNFKRIPILKHFKAYKTIKFVFLSRILPSKGTDVIIDAVRLLNANGFKGKFSVTYYGNFDESLDPGYTQRFTKTIANLPNVTYKGFLRLNNTENYNLLATYNAMLFPTFWRGEGYPGVLIDAFIAHLPVIATDWHHNTEIVNRKNGIIIPPKNAKKLAEAMETLITNTAYLKQLEIGAKQSIKHYDVNTVLKPLIQL